MTEGIIQKVINKWRNKPSKNIDQIEQELIEKIKKEICDCEDECEIKIFTKKLIGDATK
jgi:hypothetical protein